jgi:uncharacterized Zn-finger protein
MKFCITSIASDYINRKGGEITIFMHNLSGCCSGAIPCPMLKVGHPRIFLENYHMLQEAGITIYLGNDLLSYDGVAEIDFVKNLFWKYLSFNYRKRQSI